MEIFSPEKRTYTVEMRHTRFLKWENSTSIVLENTVPED